MPLRDTHGRGDGGYWGKVHPHLSHGLSMSHRSSHSAITGTRGTTTAQEHEQRAESEQRQHQAGQWSLWSCSLSERCRGPSYSKHDRFSPSPVRKSTSDILYPSPLGGSFRMYCTSITALSHSHQVERA